MLCADKQGTVREQERHSAPACCKLHRLSEAGKKRHSAPARYRVQRYGRGSKRCTAASDCFGQFTLVRFSSLPSMVSCRELLLVWALKLMFMLL